MNKGNVLLFSLIAISIIIIVIFIGVIRNNGTECLKQPFGYMMKELDLDLNCRCTDNKGEIYFLNKSELKHLKKDLLQWNIQT